MKAKYILAIAAFIFIPLFSALIVWAGGFDFDRRGNDVAVGLFLTVVCMIAIPILIATFPDE